jgi:predicted kinase
MKKCVVLTGANASGKSTFMKAVAINVILAQTINTCVVKDIENVKTNGRSGGDKPLEDVKINKITIEE